MIVECFSRSESVEETTYNYYYRMVKGQVSFPSFGDRIVVQSYGIEIERQDVCNGAVINIERDCISSISPQRHKVHNLLKLLYDKAVSPMHLVDVLGEYVDEYIIDFDNDIPNMATN